MLIEAVSPNRSSTRGRVEFADRECADPVLAGAPQTEPRAARRRFYRSSGQFLCTQNRAPSGRVIGTTCMCLSSKSSTNRSLGSAARRARTTQETGWTTRRDVDRGRTQMPPVSDHYDAKLHGSETSAPRIKKDTSIFTGLGTRGKSPNACEVTGRRVSQSATFVNTMLRWFVFSFGNADVRCHSSVVRHNAGQCVRT